MLILQIAAHFLIIVPFQASMGANHRLFQPHMFLSVTHHMTSIMAVFHLSLKKSNHLLFRPHILLSVTHHMTSIMAIFHLSLKRANQPLSRPHIFLSVPHHMISTMAVFHRPLKNLRPSPFLIKTLRPLIPIPVLNLIRMGTILWNDYCRTDVFLTLSGVNISCAGRDIHLSVILGNHR